MSRRLFRVVVRFGPCALVRVGLSLASSGPRRYLLFRPQMRLALHNLA
jgi:hypothetical protein